ncbi:response regulator transcription factor [Clostridium sp. NSJ-6]|uniref:Stage 0 sporulation protein A homolog n=1 Tax=Clostridium hominis TaxID=2763036 RepID=A0ABR7DE04_9CLOT|nr:response regulator transcription factor [Clostridium hominis]MBC5629672.1 response regulator transcription factor [Clostridium hominis]
MRLLIIEDEEDILNALDYGFRKLGYVVDTASDGEEGLELVYINNYDLVILDLNLPSIDGLDILSRIRKDNEEIKILILSARSEYIDRIKGLDMGANDYLVKPFDFGELVARVRALLRRSFTQSTSKIKCGNMIIDTSARAVYSDKNERLDLAPKEFAIFEYLIANKGRAVSTEELIEHIWGEDASMFSNSIKVHVSNLRKKLSEYSDSDIISNIRGAGYIINEVEDNDL